MTDPNKMTCEEAESWFLCPPLEQPVARPPVMPTPEADHICHALWLPGDWYPCMIATVLPTPSNDSAAALAKRDLVFADIRANGEPMDNRLRSAVCVYAYGGMGSTYLELCRKADVLAALLRS
jgi:hypothetical protein